MHMLDSKVTQHLLIMSCLEELHEWELSNSYMLKTMTGQHLYYKIVQRIVGDKSLMFKSLKDLFSGSNLSEKALRNRMLDFEEFGYIETNTCIDDGRSKYLMPTSLFHADLREHAAQAKYIFSKNFLLIDK